MMVRRLRPLGALAFLVLLYSGCGGAPSNTDGSNPTEQPAATSQYDVPTHIETENDDPDPNGIPGDWVVQRIPVDPSNLNPLLDTADAYVARITAANGYIFETALEMDKATLELHPLLAESYEISDDHLTYTFKIRKDATFSDGVPVTAKDILFTFNAIQKPENETADLRNYFADVVSAELIDDYTIRFTCNKPYFRHLEILGGLWAYPEHIYGKGDFNTQPANRQPVGSGPYVFDSWETNQQIVLRRNPNYWNPNKKVYPEKIVYKVVTDGNTAFQVFMRGELDVLGMTPEHWVNQAFTPDFDAKFNKYTYWAVSGYIGSYGYIAWNMRKPPFDDVRVRTAMTMLLNREVILQQIYYGLGRIVSGPIFSESPEYDSSIAPLPYDPEAAGKLLDEAGWVDTDNDGFRDKDGKKFSFEFSYPPGSQEVDQMVVFYKEALEKAGIEMNIRTIEWAAFLDRITKRNFDAVTLSWAIPPNSDPYQVWHSSQTEKGSNYPGYSDPEADRLLEAIRTEFDTEKRIELFHQFHRLVHDAQPYTFLFNRKSLAGISKRFNGVKIYPMGLDESQWWAPVEDQKYKP